MPSWQDSLIIASGLVRDIRGESVVTNSQPVPVAVWPALASAGMKATMVLIRPTTDVHFAIDAAAQTSGPFSAKLFSDTEYVFPLHPVVNTLYFLDAVSGTGPVNVRWVVGR